MKSQFKYQQTNLCVPIICGISDMWLFLRSSHLKLGKQSNKSSGNEEIKFPSKYKNWNSSKKQFQ